jgi:outer membrane protein assembly factor BamA
VAGALALGLCLGGPAAAIEDIGTEEDVAELLVTPREVKETGAAGRRWAVVPLVGYGKRTNGVLGVKFTNRDFLAENLTLDVRAAYSMNSQSRFSFLIGNPHVADDRFLWSLRAGYDNDPTYEFFALGTNDLGPDPITTHRRERIIGQGLFGWRPWPWLALNASATVRDYDIERGDRDGDTPFTVDFFPTIPGIKGGLTTPLSLSAVFNNRDHLIRPTKGWRAIARFSWDPPGADYEFIRLVLDAGYLHPIDAAGRHVIGARADLGYIAGPRPDVPFWELEAAGGDDTIRGYVSERFLGNTRLFLNTEYRVRLFSFAFFNLWVIGVDGALFFDVGHVYIPTSDVRTDLAPNSQVVLDSIQDGPVYGGGPGIRFGLSQALVARIDVGFSEEEMPIFYLAFGNTF